MMACTIKFCYRPVKVKIPIRHYKTSGLDNTKPSVEQIQTFLNNPRSERLSVAQVDWFQWFGLVPGLCFALVGLRSLYISLLSTESKEITSCCFDQSQNKLIYQYGGF